MSSEFRVQKFWNCYLLWYKIAITQGQYMLVLYYKD